MITVIETPTRLVVMGEEAELAEIKERFRYHPKNYFRSDAYQLWKITGGERGWDGYKYPLMLKTPTAGEMLRGRKAELVALCQALGYKMDLSKQLNSPFKDLTLAGIPDDLIEADFRLDLNQKTAILEWLKNGMGVANMAVNSGKCLGRGTPVLCFDGSTKLVEDVNVGDLLMGPDSQPRKVLALGSGTGQMFQVTQGNGDAYACNGDHVLALESSGYFRRGNGKYGSKTWTRSSGQRVEVSVVEYLKWPKTRRNQHKGYKSGLIEFPSSVVPVDAYFMGLWLGNGNSANQSVTIRDADAALVDYLRCYAASFGLVLSDGGGDGCTTWRLSSPLGNKAGAWKNPLLAKLRQLQVIGNKHIPLIYLRNNAEIRWQLLSGLIDTDGAIGACGVELTFTKERLAYDTAWLMRSLGLRVTLTPKKTTCQTGVEGTAWRIWAKGDFSPLTLRAARKYALPSPKRGLRYAVHVEEMGIGDWFGFTLDGDGLFLLGDFTVTHNTATFAAAASLIKRHFPDARFLYFTFSERLVKQVMEALQVFLPDWSITQYGGGGKRDPSGKDIVVATQAILNRNFQWLEREGFFKTFHALLLDESHHCQSPTAEKVLRACSAYFRMAASDSLKEGDPDKFNRISGLCGPVLCEVTSSQLIQQSRSAAPHLYLVDIQEWHRKFKDVSHEPEPGSVAWTLVDNQWMKGTYLGPVPELDRHGQPKMKRQRKLVGGQWVSEIVPVTVPTFHLLRLNGAEVQALARQTVLDRRYDRAIIRFKERNQLICDWADYYSKKGWSTVVVATRTPHVLILEALLSARIPGLVRCLTGEASTSQRNEMFGWLKRTRGAVLVTPLIREGVSINELRAGIVADVIADWEVAKQVLGRFMRRKEVDNTCHVTWFIDRQCPVYFKNVANVMEKLGRIEGLTFYHPVAGPETIPQALIHHGNL